MKKAFAVPTIAHAGCLASITAVISLPTISDVALKTDIQPHEPVLDRIRQLTSPSSNPDTRD